MHRVVLSTWALRFYILIVHVGWDLRTSRRKETQGMTPSGLRMWVDPETLQAIYQLETSRGEVGDLVMRDAFKNAPGRSFRPRDDHLWSSIEPPDGGNAALEVSAHNVVPLQVWNEFLSTRGFEAVTFVRGLDGSIVTSFPPLDIFLSLCVCVSVFSRWEVQSWNKCCMQGGMVEVRVQLPRAISEAAGHPDSSLGPSARVTSRRSDPTWPGISMMGTLGRAIFRGSTTRMLWPFSYDACEPETFKPSHQRMSACDADSGSRLHPHQGRGESDIVEAGGTSNSSSIQIGPG
ncbi:hypothetical protein PsorP6_015218 [Peronosclerospora sorghi]|uniref:Uncharacterized protein n=1 Tax=Peronosclerospora sorghi TaxID=230839 RepID=A0ACC0VR95_9STRA|nr:hypothetical protein PsorP6_015218 [Peronosclerospora sorghi]